MPSTADLHRRLDELAHRVSALEAAPAEQHDPLPPETFWALTELQRRRPDDAATEGLGTTGQLHHHLRQLKAAGWLHQTGRGTYEVPARRVVPLLTMIQGARR